MLIFAALIFFLSFVSSSGQTKGFGEFNLLEQMKSDAGSLAAKTALEKNLGILGDVVEPDKYRLGPGDVLLVQNLSLALPPETVVVTPDMKAFLTRAGAVDLKDATLADAQKLISEKIASVNPSAIVRVALRKPRTVLVKIDGDVLWPGVYSLPANFRVSTALKYANQIKSSATLGYQQNAYLSEKLEQDKRFKKTFANAGLPYFSAYSNRNVSIIRADGKSRLVDLDLAAAEGSIDEDPYVREGDEIFVPYPPQEYPKIKVAGEVTRPYMGPYKNGDKASKILKFGGSLKETADINDVVLLQPISGKKIRLKIDKDLNLLGQDYDLEPGASIIIGKKKIAPSPKTGLVSLIGEFKSPGVYSIIDGKTKLSEVVKEAGGFTKDAYLPLAKIVRRNPKFFYYENQKRAIYELMQYSPLTAQDTMRFGIDASLKIPSVSCDFLALFQEGDSSKDVPLKDGDVVKVPSNPRFVYVFGQVKNPGFVEYKKGKNLLWYVEKAGGFAQSADESRASVIRGKNKVWIEGDHAAIFAGDAIYVPAPEQTPPGVRQQTWAMIAGVITAIASLAGTLSLILRTK